jgi:hypothetical protein
MNARTCCDVQSAQPKPKQQQQQSTHLMKNRGYLAALDGIAPGMEMLIDGAVGLNNQKFVQ